MKRVLITGGSGFLAGWLIPQLTTEGAAVACVDIRPPPAGTPSNVRFERVDVRDLSLLTRCFEDHRPDVVVHLAGTLMMAAERDPNMTWTTNVDGTWNCFHAAASVRAKRLVLASSGAVHLTMPSADPDHAAPPGLWYGMSKFVAEQIAVMFARRRGIAASIARLYTVVGPRRRSASESGTDWTSLLLERAVLGSDEPIKVYRDGAPVVYVKDVVRALALMTSSSSNLAVHEIWGGEEMWVAPMLEVLRARGLRAPPLEYPPVAEDAALATLTATLRRPAPQPGWEWEPRYRLADMIDDVVAELKREPG